MEELILPYESLLIYITVFLSPTLVGKLVSLKPHLNDKKGKTTRKRLVS